MRVVKLCQAFSVAVVVCLAHAYSDVAVMPPLLFVLLRMDFAAADMAARYMTATTNRHRS